MVALERHHAGALLTLRADRRGFPHRGKSCRGDGVVRYELSGEAVVSAGSCEDAHSANAPRGRVHLRIGRSVGHFQCRRRIGRGNGGSTRAEVWIQNGDDSATTSGNGGLDDIWRTALREWKMPSI